MTDLEDSQNLAVCTSSSCLLPMSHVVTGLSLVVLPCKLLDDWGSLDKKLLDGHRRFVIVATVAQVLVIQRSHLLHEMMTYTVASDD